MSLVKEARFYLSRVDQENVEENAKRGALAGAVSGGLHGFTNTVHMPKDMPPRERLLGAIRKRLKHGGWNALRGTLVASSATAAATLYANRNAIDDARDKYYDNKKK